MPPVISCPNYIFFCLVFPVPNVMCQILGEPLKCNYYKLSFLNLRSCDWRRRRRRRPWLGKLCLSLNGRRDGINHIHTHTTRTCIRSYTHLEGPHISLSLSLSLSRTHTPSHTHTLPLSLWLPLSLFHTYKHLHRDRCLNRKVIVCWKV